MKIGAIDFSTELELLKSIRQEFSKEDIELRVDANGVFLVSEALEKLKILSEFDLHSIEQPIKQGQWDEMARLCEGSPVPIALDEELIGAIDLVRKKELLQTISMHIDLPLLMHFFTILGQFERFAINFAYSLGKIKIESKKYIIVIKKELFNKFMLVREFSENMDRDCHCIIMNMLFGCKLPKHDYMKYFWSN